MPLLKKSPSTVVEPPKQKGIMPTAIPNGSSAGGNPQLVVGDFDAIERKLSTRLAKTAANETMSKADWHDKDTRISRQGLFQACLQSVGLLQLNTGNDLKSYLDLVEQAAERGLEFVNKKS